MFISKERFKKLVKDSYKHGGLVVGQTEKGILILGGHNWQLEIDSECMYKTHLAAIIECTGYIPKPGEAVKFFESEKECVEQNELIDTAYLDLFSAWAERANDKGCQYAFTRVILASADGYQWVMQNQTVAQEKCLMYDRIAMMIDLKTLDRENGENEPVFASRANDCFMYFGNNIMVLMVKKWNPMYEGEVNLMQKLCEVNALYSTKLA